MVKEDLPQLPEAGLVLLQILLQRLGHAPHDHLVLLLDLMDVLADGQRLGAGRVPLRL